MFATKRICLQKIDFFLFFCDHRLREKLKGESAKCIVLEFCLSGQPASFVQFARDHGDKPVRACCGVEGLRYLEQVP